MFDLKNMSLAELCLLREFYCNFSGDIGEQILSKLAQLHKVQLGRSSYGRPLVWLYNNGFLI